MKLNNRIKFIFQWRSSKRCKHSDKRYLSIIRVKCCINMWHEPVYRRCTSLLPNVQVFIPFSYPLPATYPMKKYNVARKYLWFFETPKNPSKSWLFLFFSWFFYSKDFYNNFKLRVWEILTFLVTSIIEFRVGNDSMRHVPVRRFITEHFLFFYFICSVCWNYFFYHGFIFILNEIALFCSSLHYCSIMHNLF